jgi:hypothetical protein
VLERGISVVVAADGVMVVLVAIVSPGTRENEVGEEGLTLMPTTTLADRSIAITVIEKSSKMTKTEP